MSTKAGQIFIELRANADRLKADMSGAQEQVEKFSKAGRSAGDSTARGMSDASEAVRKFTSRASEALLGLEGAHRVLSAAVARYGVSAISSGAATDNLVNSYRALRIALSPTPFTVAAVAVGILTEETVKLINARAKLIEQQSLIAAISRTPVTTVERLDRVATISGGSGSGLRSLSGSLSSRIDNNQSAVRTGLNALGISASAGRQNEPLDPELLKKIAEGFGSIEDPAKRAAAAVAIFGAENAGEALRQLDQAFLNASDAAAKFGTVLDSVSRTQIFQARQDFLRLKTTLTDFSLEKAWWESFKQGAEVLGAAAEDGAKRGAKAVDDLIARYTLLRGVLAPLNTPPPIDQSRQRSIDQGITADTLFAEAQGARARSGQTLEGQRAAQQAAKERADTAYSSLAADAERRYINPHDQNLLTPEARFKLAAEQASASAVSASLLARIADLESVQRVTDQRLVAAAAGGGYQAKKGAEIDGQVSREVAERGGDAGALRSRLSAEYDARHAAEVAGTLKELREQIDLERTLAGAQAFGSEGVNRATLEVKLHRIAVDNDSESARKLIQAEKDLYAARRSNSDEARIATLSENIAAIQRVTAAAAGGSEAVRIAELQNKYAELRRSGAGATVPFEQQKDAAEKKKSDAEEIASIDSKIKATERLTAAVKEGSEALRKATLENKYEDLRRSGHAAAIPEQKLLDDADKRHDDAVKAKKDADDEAESIQKLNERLDLEIAAQNRLTIAIGQGSEARRIAELQTKDLERRASDKTGTPSPLLGLTVEDLKQAGIDQTANRNRLTEQALSAGGAPQDRLRVINDQLAALAQVKVTEQNIVDIELARRALGEEQLQVMVRERLAVGTLKDGWAAFWTEQKEQAEKPGQILYEGLRDAKDKLTSDLAKLITGQHTSFGKDLQAIGGKLSEDSLKALEQQGLGALAKKFPSLGQGSLGKTLGLDTAAKNGRQDGQTSPGAIWVQIANQGQNGPTRPGGAIAPANDPFGKFGSIFGGSQGGGVFNFAHQKSGGGIGGFFGSLLGGAASAFLGGGLNLGSLFGGKGGDGLTPDVFSKISYGGAFATGGDINPGNAYMVGERGPEMVVPRGSGTVIPNGQLGHTYNISVDARGADENVIMDRVTRGVIAAHKSAISTSVQATIERAKRTPGGA